MQEAYILIMLYFTVMDCQILLLLLLPPLEVRNGKLKERICEQEEATANEKVHGKIHQSWLSVSSMLTNRSSATARRQPRNSEQSTPQIETLELISARRSVDVVYQLRTCKLQACFQRIETRHHKTEQ